MTNVASYSLFRHEASAYESPRCGASRGVFFANFLPTLVRAHRSCFPGWALQIHHDDRVQEFPYFRVMERMHEAGMLRLVPMGEAKTLCGSMLWRMLPAWGASVDRFICRDVDSLPTIRERVAVDRWIHMGEPVLSLHDSESHLGTQLMGGMIGVDLRKLVEVYGWIGSSFEFFANLQAASGIDFNRHGSDQVFLNSLQNRPLTRHEIRDGIGPKADPRDICGGHARHLGGAFHALPVRQWYDANYPDEEVIRIEKECGFAG